MSRECHEKFSSTTALSTECVEVAAAGSMASICMRSDVDVLLRRRLERV